MRIQLLDVKDDGAVCHIDHDFHDQAAASAAVDTLLQSPETLCEKDTCISLGLGHVIDSDVRVVWLCGCVHAMSGQNGAHAGQPLVVQTARGADCGIRQVENQGGDIDILF